MNSKAIRVFAVLVILVTLSSASFAQIRVRFARGRTSATMTGSIAGGATRQGVVTLQAPILVLETDSGLFNSVQGRPQTDKHERTHP